MNQHRLQQMQQISPDMADGTPGSVRPRELSIDMSSDGPPSTLCSDSAAADTSALEVDAALQRTPGGDVLHIVVHGTRMAIALASTADSHAVSYTTEERDLLAGSSFVTEDLEQRAPGVAIPCLKARSR